MTTYTIKSSTDLQNQASHVVLGEPLDLGGIAVFKSTEYHNSSSATNTNINLWGKSGYLLLHISIRAASDTIVFNHYGTKWGTEERVPLGSAFTRGVQPTVVVFNRGDYFKVRVGNVVHNFRIRIADTPVKFSHSYDGSNLFSSTILANVFTLTSLLGTIAPTYA